MAYIKYDVFYDPIKGRWYFQMIRSMSEFMDHYVMVVHREGRIRTSCLSFNSIDSWSDDEWEQCPYYKEITIPNHCERMNGWIVTKLINDLFEPWLDTVVWTRKLKHNQKVADDKTGD